MFRRDFIQRASIVGAGGLASLGSADAGQKATVKYTVKGFSCFTCAMGLQVLLQKQHGVLGAKACYPEATVVIDFDPSLVTEDALKKFIADAGFHVTLAG